MRVDFYHLGAVPLEQVVASLVEKLLGKDERLLIVSSEEAQLARLDRILWDSGPTTFFPHGMAGGSDDSRQPVLLSKTPDPANRARNILVADGKWRDSALAFDRAFYLFDQTTIEEARDAWRLLSDREKVECHYWAHSDGRWSEMAAS